MRFWHWFQWATQYGYGNDYGYVQVSTRDPAGEWSAWVNVSPQLQLSSGVWSESQVDLTPYAGQTIRVGFLHVGTANPSSSRGWYIDDVRIPGAVCSSGLALDYAEGQLNITATNGTTEPGTWSLSVAQRDRLSSVRSEPIDVTDPPVQTVVSVPIRRPSGEIGVLSRINIPGKGIRCSAWQTVDTSRTP
jgi:hypothetical protein